MLLLVWESCLLWCLFGKNIEMITFVESRGLIILKGVCGLIVPRGTLPYLPNFTKRTFTSAGETPGMREACPMFSGRIRDSFCRASIVREFIE